MTENQPSKNSWEILRQYTEARIALGRTGASLTTNNILLLNEAHASARDAIYQEFEKSAIEKSLQEINLQSIQLTSKVNNKKEFLLRPDLGRRLSEESIVKIKSQAINQQFDICINISEGLSATAVNTNAIPLLNILIKKWEEAHLKIAPVCIIENGRVAISDETGYLLNSKVSIILIGERPGLSASDSMGAYITYHPKPGNTDEQRNCVSNIRKGGLSYEAASSEIFSLTEASIRLEMSGTLLKSTLALHSNQ
jgi:ethanolamine ammonia-lyase small subunit